MIRKLLNFTQFILIMFVMLLFLIVLASMTATLNTVMSRSPAAEFSNVTSSLSSDFFVGLISQEIPGDSNKDITINTQKNTGLLLTAIGLSEQNKPVASEQDAQEPDSLQEHLPPEAQFIPEPLKQEVETVPTILETTPVKEDLQTNDPVILIYHSHNQESWLPELKDINKASLAFNPEINVTLLGERLQKNLKESNINSIHSKRDYQTAIKNFEYPKSYVYSKKTVKEALAVNRNIKYLFDIHRDSQGRSKTTVKVNNHNYAQVYFVVGEKNPDWKQNYKFAEKIHEKLNEKVPGISKGIYNKNAHGNGEYNQSLSPYSSLIEIGGVENTLEESYRTVDVLTEVISELTMDAKAVTNSL